MEHIKKQDAIKHTHSSGCVVYEYPMKNVEMNIGVAEINCRYPDRGYAINHECSEMGYVLKGAGKLVIDTQEVILSEGDVVYIPQGGKFYWEGNMTLILPATPAWHPAQHEVLALLC
jgi:mannose-6-phosphate isomerase-like protein (cupin superfamily)